MKGIGRSVAALGLVFFLGASAQAADPWREKALKAAERLAQTIELLDEALHDAHAGNPTPAFTKAIEDIHHIEQVLTKLRTGLPTALFATLCAEMKHLYDDLVQIRLDLIALGLEKNPPVVKTWNDMVAIYNKELSPLFGQCRQASSADASAYELETLGDDAVSFDCRGSGSHFSLDTERSALTLKRDAGTDLGDTVVELRNTRSHVGPWGQLHFQGVGDGPSRWTQDTRGPRFIVELTPNRLRREYDLKVRRFDSYSGGYELLPFRALTCAAP